MITAPKSFYVTGGTLQHDARCYVKRKADAEIYDALSQGEFCYVLTSRQMGKSSLMVRTAVRLRAEGVRVAVLDLTALGQNLTSEQWYNGLLNSLGSHLGLEEELEQFWLEHGRLAPLQRWMRALREVVLPEVARRQTPDASGLAGRTDPGRGQHPSEAGVCRLTSGVSRLVIFIDEIDATRSLPFSTDEFFAAIREWYNRRAQDPELQRLTFCLLGVASPSDLIQDTRMTPFNIGRRIELNDFTEAEAAPLAYGFSHHGAGYPRSGWQTRRGTERVTGLNVTGSQVEPNLQPSNLPTCNLTVASVAATRFAGTRLRGEKIPTLEARFLLKRILYWTGGQPYLTQRLCQAVAQEVAGPTPNTQPPTPSVVDRLCDELFLSHGARLKDENLTFVRERLLRSGADLAGLLDLYARVRRGEYVRDDDTNARVETLRLAGITRLADARRQTPGARYDGHGLAPVFVGLASGVWRLLRV